MLRLTLSEDPEDDVGEEDGTSLLEDDGDLTGGLAGDLDDDEPLLIDDIETDDMADLQDRNDEDDESDDDDLDDDMLIESDKTDTLADLLRMGHGSSGSVETSSLLEEWQRRESDRNVTSSREAAAAEKRRQKTRALAEFERERGIGLLTEDPICRAVVVCVTTGSPADCDRVEALRHALKSDVGDLVELIHNPDPDPDPDLPLFEVWIEGYRMRILHARNWRNDGDLDDSKINNIVRAVKYEVSDDAGDVIATYSTLDGD